MFYKGLVINYGEEGGYKTGGRGASEVLSLQNEEGGRQSFSHTNGGGGTTSFEVVLTRELDVFAILMGGTNSFHPFKKKRGGGQKVLPCLEGGGGQNVSDP